MRLQAQPGLRSEVRPTKTLKHLSRQSQFKALLQLSKLIVRKAITSRLIGLATLLAMSVVGFASPTKAQNSEGSKSARVGAAAKERAPKITFLLDRPCPAMKKDLKDMDVKDFDNCVYNGATFKDWAKFHEAIEAARTYCEKRNWVGRTKVWDVYFKEWLALSCKSVKKL